MRILFQLEGIVDGTDQFDGDGREHGIEREAGAEKQAGSQHDSPEHADEVEQQRIKPVREQPQRPAVKTEFAAIFAHRNTVSAVPIRISASRMLPTMRFAM